MSKIYKGLGSNGMDMNPKAPMWLHGLHLGFEEGIWESLWVLNPKT